MEIDSEGRIWRVGKRGYDRWAGEVRTNRCERVRAEKTIPSGYLIVRAMVDGKRMTGMAHRLVWRHNYGPLADGLVINHRNGVKTDNRPENIELVTRSENARHATRVLEVGRAADQCGEKNHAAKLTTQQVEEIRRRRATGEKLHPIAADFGVAFQTVSRIARGTRRGSG
jgi:hypothetical protein